MIRLFLVLSIFLNVSVIPCANAQKITLDPSERNALKESNAKSMKDRFFLRADRQMGAITLDTKTGIEYMRCPVGTTYIEGEIVGGKLVGNRYYEKEFCAGESQKLNWGEVQLVLKKAGGGWRLPSPVEFDNFREYVWGLLAYDGPAYWTNLACPDSTYTRVTRGRDSNSRVHILEPLANCSMPDEEFSIMLVRKATRK